MGRAILFLRNNPKYIYYTVLIFIFPALLLNLGLMPLLADEATRATVALEMILSGNYILPTIGGEYYYNKPPLFNWILAGMFRISGQYSEFIIRLSAIIPLLLFALIIYFFVKKNVSKKTATFSALAMLTFARMLFYDSMLGHIDILFSLVTFLSFIALYEFYRKDQKILLFVVTYILTAIGFLLKGLPSLAFQAISLLVFFVSNKNFHSLFGYKHLLGILFFFIITGSYYFILSGYVSIDTYYQTLITESGKRTVTNKGILNNILYIFQFPFEQILFHLFPWGLLIVFCLNKKYWNYIKLAPFLKFVFRILIFNTIIYWISPETRPRYLFMLYPLIFILFFEGYFYFANEYKKLQKIFEALLLIFASLACIVTAGIPFFNLGQAVISHFYFKWISMCMLTVSTAYLLWMIREQRLIIFILFLLVVRITFNLFILPQRFYNGSEKKYRDQIKEIAMLSAGDSLYIHQNVYLKHSEHYYLDMDRGSIPPRIDTLLYKKGFTMIDHHAGYPSNALLIDSFRLEWLDQKIYLIKIK